MFTSSEYSRIFQIFHRSSYFASERAIWEEIITLLKTCSLSFVRSIIFTATFFLVTQFIPSFTSPVETKTTTLKWVAKLKKEIARNWSFRTGLPSTQSSLENVRSHRPYFASCHGKLKSLTPLVPDWLGKTQILPKSPEFWHPFDDRMKSRTKSQTSARKAFSFETHYPGSVNHSALFFSSLWLASGYFLKQTTIDQFFSRQMISDHGFHPKIAAGFSQRNNF